MDLNFPLAVHVKTGKKKTEIVGYDEITGEYILAVAARPIDNEANREILRFFKKLTGKQVLIRSGMGSKRKVLELYRS